MSGRPRKSSIQSFSTSVRDPDKPKQVRFSETVEIMNANPVLPGDIHLCQPGHDTRSKAPPKLIRQDADAGDLQDMLRTVTVDTDLADPDAANEAATDRMERKALPRTASFDRITLDPRTAILKGGARVPKVYTELGQQDKSVWLEDNRKENTIWRALRGLK